MSLTASAPQRALIGALETHLEERPEEGEEGLADDGPRGLQLDEKHGDEGRRAGEGLFLCGGGVWM